MFDFLNETGSLHLVDDLLFGLCLSDEVGVGTRGRDESAPGQHEWRERVEQGGEGGRTF